MAWHRIGDKPLSEPMLTQFTDVYMRHQGEMSPIQHQAIVYTNADPIHWRIYAALGGDGLRFIDASANCVIIGSDNGLLPDSTKALPEPMSMYHKCSLVAFIHMCALMGKLKIWFTKICLKITHSKWHPNLPASSHIIHLKIFLKFYTVRGKYLNGS